MAMSDQASANHPALPEDGLSRFLSEHGKHLAKLIFVNRHGGESRFSVRKDIADKWSSDLAGTSPSFRGLPKRHRHLMCAYAELISLFDGWVCSGALPGTEPPVSYAASIPRYVEEAAARMVGPTARSAVVGKCYNYLTGKLEYVLEDGNFLPVDLTTRPEKRIDDTMLPDCILAMTDPIARRESRINQVDA